MHRYFVELFADPFFTNEFAYWFPGNDDAYITVDGEARLLTGNVFSLLETFHEVSVAANRVVDEMHAVLAIQYPWLERPQVGIPYRVEPDGTKVWGDNCGSGGGMILLPVRTLPADLSSIPTPTKAQLMRAAMKSNAHLDLAMTIFFLPRTTWPHLYRCLEEIESFLEMKVSTAGMCSQGERERFTRTANTAEAAGHDARHGLGKFTPPKHPMNLEEATKFLRSLCAQAIERAMRGPKSAA